MPGGNKRNQRRITLLEGRLNRGETYLEDIAGQFVPGGQLQGYSIQTDEDGFYRIVHDPVDALAPAPALPIADSTPPPAQSVPPPQRSLQHSRQPRQSTAQKRLVSSLSQAAQDIARPDLIPIVREDRQFHLPSRSSGESVIDAVLPASFSSPSSSSWRPSLPPPSPIVAPVESTSSGSGYSLPVSSKAKAVSGVSPSGSTQAAAPLPIARPPPGIGATIGTEVAVPVPSHYNPITVGTEVIVPVPDPAAVRQWLEYPHTQLPPASESAPAATNSQRFAIASLDLHRTLDDKTSSGFIPESSVKACQTLLSHNFRLVVCSYIGQSLDQPEARQLESQRIRTLARWHVVDLSTKLGLTFSEDWQRGPREGTLLFVIVDRKCYSYYHHHQLLNGKVSILTAYGCLVHFEDNADICADLWNNSILAYQVSDIWCYNSRPVKCRQLEYQRTGIVDRHLSFSTLQGAVNKFIEEYSSGVFLEKLDTLARAAHYHPHLPKRILDINNFFHHTLQDLSDPSI